MGHVGGCRRGQSRGGRWGCQGLFTTAGAWHWLARQLGFLRSASGRGTLSGYPEQDLARCFPEDGLPLVLAEPGEHLSQVEERGGSFRCPWCEWGHLLLCTLLLHCRLVCCRLLCYSLAMLPRCSLALLLCCPLTRLPCCPLAMLPCCPLAMLLCWGLNRLHCWLLEGLLTRLLVRLSH